MWNAKKPCAFSRREDAGKGGSGMGGGIHDRADSFVACTCFYIAEDAEY